MKSPKHHYIPIFYLKKWVGPDGRLVEFSRPYGTAVKPRRTHPDGTGYVRGLYRLPGVSDQMAELVEREFLKSIDDIASYALLKLLRKDLDRDDWSSVMRSAWSRFIIGVLIRSPKSVAEIKSRMFDGFPEMWENLRIKQLEENQDKPPLAEFNPLQVERGGLLALQGFIDNPKIGGFLNNMSWSVLDVARSQERFLTSDRPIVMTNGLALDSGHVAVPLSPTMLFLATNNEKTTQSIHRMPVREVVRACNKQVVRNAAKYVWAHNESQSALVKAQLSLDLEYDRQFFTERPKQTAHLD